MLWILTAVIFSGLAVREIAHSRGYRRGYSRAQPLYKPYLFMCIALALACAWQPFKIWRFERHLAANASELADHRPATVHCNTILDTMLDSEQLASGHANLQSGEIVFQYGWCERLLDYLAAPEQADAEDFFALHMFTHESMHVRGEANEAKTECQAIQRDYRVAKMLGVPPELAHKQALAHYQNSYLPRKQQGALSAQYYSDECTPGGALDEHLDDSTWSSLY